MSAIRRAHSPSSGERKGISLNPAPFGAGGYKDRLPLRVEKSFYKNNFPRRMVWKGQPEKVTALYLKGVELLLIS